MRHHMPQELMRGSSLVLDGSIAARLSEPAASKERLQILQQGPILLVQREREQWPYFKSEPKPGPLAEGHAEASFAFGQAGHEPWIQRSVSIGCLVFDEGRRIAHRMDSRLHRGRHASPFGSVVTGSLGLPSGSPFASRREGFPDMSRCTSLLAERQGKLYLPD